MHLSEIVLEETSDSEWLFKQSKKQIMLIDQLEKAEELMDVNDFDQALGILESILENAPECIEAYNDIYLCYLYKNQFDKAFKYLKNGVNNILDALPESFLLNPEQKLFWGFLENRPFLRLYVNLANEYLDRRNVKAAQSMYEKVLQWNPNDNQGVRERVLICYFEQGLLDKILKIEKNEYPYLTYNHRQCPYFGYLTISGKIYLVYEMKVSVWHYLFRNHV